MKITAHSSMLDILKCGGRVRLPSGYEFEGDPSSGYIQLWIPEGECILSQDGVTNLSEQGLKEAFQSAEEFENNSDE